MAVIIQRREMVDRVVEKEGAERMELEKTKRCQRQGLEEWDGVLQGSPVLGVGIPTSQHRKLRHRESSGAIFPKKREKPIPFPSTPEGCCFAGASPEAVMGVRETASGSSAASSPIPPPTAWRTMKSLSEIAERRCRNRG